MVVIRKRTKNSARSESNDSDCIVLDDERPARNVNGLFIDLTENTSQNAKYEPPKKALKLTKYNRIESPSSTPKKLQKKASPNVFMTIDLSNDQPTCSRSQVPSTSNAEPKVKINKPKEESNVQLDYSPKASSSNKSRRESFSLIPCLLGMDLDFIPNMKPFECKICFETIEPGNGIILYNCLHEFCKDCLSGQIEAAEEFQVKCPWNKCQEFLREREIKSLVSNEVFEKHLLKSLKIAEHGNELAFHCRTPDCPIFMEIVEEVPTFICPSCRKVNCIKCKAIHEGKSCKDYQEEINPKLKTDRLNNENLQSEDAIKKLIATNQAMYCPKCSIPVMKISGCDFISCTACKLGICWVTKKPRKDLKKADGTIIKGCKCMELPLMKRCHPKCGHCH